MYTENNIVYEDKNKKVLLACIDKTIENFKIDKNTQVIRKDAFKGCRLLRNVDLDTENFVEVEYGAFPEDSIKYLRIADADAKNNSFNLASLETLNFSENASAVLVGLFYTGSLNLAPNLKEINIEKEIHLADHISFSIDGVWCVKDKDKNCIMYYPPGRMEKTYKVPNNITGIDDYSFNCNPFIETIVFHKNIRIEPYVFACNCKNLKNIVYLGNKENMSFYVDNCPKFDTIYTNVKNIKTDKSVTFKSVKEFLEQKTYSFKEMNNIYKSFEDR
jgi:hypothetical protein